MSSPVVIENKVSSIRKYLKILNRYKKFSREKIENDIDIRGAVERYLYLVSQATIDLAEAFISFKKFRKPLSYSDAFYILQEEGVITKKLTGKMVQMAGFRNVMAHDYEGIDYDIVYHVLHEGITDIKGFIKVISQ